MEASVDIKICLIQCSFYDVNTGKHLFSADVVTPPRGEEIVRYQDQTQPGIEDAVWIVASVTHVFRKGYARVSHYTAMLRKL